jgi:site-specific recombinase XerD
MGTFNYKLRTSTNGTSTIYIQYSYGKIKRPDGSYKQRLYRSSTGYTVNNPKNWLDKANKIKVVNAEPYASKWNTHLTDLKTEFEKKVNEALNNGESLDNGLLKEIQQSIDFTRKETKKRKGFDLNDLLEGWVNYYETRKRTRTGRNPTKGTIKSIKNTKETLKEFLKTNPVSSPKKINTTLYEDLLNYLEGEGLANNTIGKIVKNTKAFFTYLKEDDNHRIDLPNYIPSKWVVLKEEIDEIYLTTEELMKMFYLDLSGVKESYSRARDLFLISAFTGLRISDNKRLEEKNIITIDEHRFFRIEHQKTHEDVYIPIVEVVDEILKRNGGIPKSMVDQTVNRLIKDIAEWSGIDEKHTVKRTEGGKEVEETKPKFEWVKSHTGRRSFCTNAYLGGMDSISIMAVSGHTTEKNFLNYIKVPAKQQAVRNAKHEYIRSLSPSKFNEDGTHKLQAV